MQFEGVTAPNPPHSPQKDNFTSGSKRYNLLKAIQLQKFVRAECQIFGSLQQFYFIYFFIKTHNLLCINNL